MLGEIPKITSQSLPWSLFTRKYTNNTYSLWCVCCSTLLQEPSAAFLGRLSSAPDISRRGHKWWCANCGIQIATYFYATTVIKSEEPSLVHFIARQKISEYSAVPSRCGCAKINLASQVLSSHKDECKSIFSFVYGRKGPEMDVFLIDFNNRIALEFVGQIYVL